MLYCPHTLRRMVSVDNNLVLIKNKGLFYLPVLLFVPWLRKIEDY